MKRVCCYCEKWESGGIESFLFNVLTHMDLSELEVDIVAAQLMESVFSEKLKELGIRFYELSGSPRKLFSNGHAFRRLMVERKYDVLHLNIFHSLSLYYAKLAYDTGIPLRIAHSHNTALRKSLTRPLKNLLHILGKQLWGGYATDRWACSGAAAAFMFTKKYCQKGYSFIPNGIDVYRFLFSEGDRARVRQELGVQNELVIGHVGRFCYQKNQSFLLDVLEKLLQQWPKSCLLLVGEGEDRAMLEEKTARLGLEKNVIFYGLSNRVEELMWAMDVFLFPSQFEGLGIVAVEAQAAGLPVLCSDNVPAEALLLPQQVTRLPISEDSCERWVESIIKTMPETRVLAANQVAKMGFDISTVVQMIRQAYMGTICDDRTKDFNPYTGV